MLSGYKILMMLTSLCACTQAQAQNLSAWPETFYQTAITIPDSVPNRFAEALFNRGSSIEIFHDRYSKKLSPNFYLGHDVFDNFDGTLTHIRRVRVGVSSKILGLFDAKHDYLPKPGRVAFAFGGMSLGVAGFLEITDSEQINATERGRIHALATNDQNVDLQTVNATEINPFLASNDFYSGAIRSLQANASIPFAALRIPLSRHDVRKMKDGEIVTYTLAGEAGFGLGLGLNAVLKTFAGGGLGLGIETHVTGAFEVTIMRESERFAKVRITRISEKTTGADLYAGVSLYKVLRGVYFLRDLPGIKLLSRFDLKMIPFELDEMKSKTHELTVAYRYDLESTEGRDAFHRAVLGSFERSEGNASAKRLFSQSTDIVTTGSNIATDLSYAYHHRREKNVQRLTTHIDSDEDNKTLFQTSQKQVTDASTLFSNYERTNHRLSVLINKEEFTKKSPQAVLVVSDNFIDDSRSKAKELNQYFRKIEELTYESGIFPVMDQTKNRNFGQSSFFYGFAIKDAGLKKLFSLSAHDVASSFRKEDFLQAKDAYFGTDPDQAYEKLSTFFTREKNAEQISGFLSSLLDGPGEIEKFSIAESPAFGSYQSRGHTLQPLEKDFIAMGPRFQARDQNWRTPLPNDISVSHVNVESLDQSRYLLTFSLTGTCEYLKFKISTFDRRGKHRIAGDVLIYNSNHRFTEGENSLELSPNSLDPLSRYFYRKLAAHEQYLFTVEASHTAAKPGEADSGLFQTGDVVSENEF